MAERPVRGGRVLHTILHVIDSGGLYGAEMVLLTLAQEQRELGHVPVIGSLRSADEPPRPLEIEAARRGLPVEVLPIGNDFRLRNVGSVMRRLFSANFDVVHSHGYKGNILLAWGRRTRLRPATVATAHGWTGVRAAGARIWLYERLDSFALARLDAVIAVTQAMRTHRNLRLVAPERVFVVANSVRVGAAVQASCNQQQDGAIDAFVRGGFTILAAGRLSPEKAFDRLLRAVHHARSQGCDVRLLLMGEGECAPELRELTDALGLQDVVLMPGFVANGARWLHRAQLFALSSLTEGMPVVLLEAMQAGVAVVATSVGGVPGLLQQGELGCLVPPDDVDALAGALVALYRDDGLRSRYAESARSAAQRRAGERGFAREYLDIYATVLSRRDRPMGEVA